MSSADNENSDITEADIEKSLLDTDGTQENLSSKSHASVHKDQLSEELLERSHSNWKNHPFVLKVRNIARFFGMHFLKFLFAISLIFVYLEYDQSLTQQKISNSFEMVKDWERQGTVQDYNVFSQRVQKLSDRATSILLDRGILVANDKGIIVSSETGNTDDRAILISNFVKRNYFKDISSEEEAAIGRVLYFFNKVGLCIDAKLCEAKFLVEFFGDSVKVFWFYYQSQAAFKRDNLKLKNHAEYTERFVEELS